MDIRWREKKRAYIVTAVDRQTHTIVSHQVCWERTPEALQHVVDDALHAERYYSDAFRAYEHLCYWGEHTLKHDKSETYTVEGGNADSASLPCTLAAFIKMLLALHCRIATRG